MRSEDLAFLGEDEGRGFTLTPVQRAELLEDILDVDTTRELARLTAEIRRCYAPTPQCRAENGMELEPLRMAITARRAELRAARQ